MKLSLEGAVIESHLLDLGSSFFRSAQSLLEATKKLVLLAVGKRLMILVSQLTVFLL